MPEMTEERIAEMQAIVQRLAAHAPEPGQINAMYQEGFFTSLVSDNNARLIAAAPDLLAGLRESLEEIERLQRVSGEAGRVPEMRSG
jgi:hypothetical protein